MFCSFVKYVYNWFLYSFNFEIFYFIKRRVVFFFKDKKKILWNLVILLCINIEIFGGFYGIREFFFRNTNVKNKVF